MNPDQAPLGDKAEIRLASDGIRLFCGFMNGGKSQLAAFTLTPTLGE
jgi:hypothetical protein